MVGEECVPAREIRHSTAQENVGVRLVQQVAAVEIDVRDVASV